MNSVNLTHLLDVLNLVFQCLLSFMAVTIYIIDTYYPEITPDSSPEDIKIKNELSWTELGVSILICLTYIIGFIMSNKKLKYVLSIYNILDLFTAIPSFFMFVEGLNFKYS